MFTAGRVAEVAQQHAIFKGNAGRIAVDDTWVGGGVVDLLRAQGWPVNAVNFGEKPKCDPDQHFNRRTELWTVMRDWSRDEASLADLSQSVRQELEGDVTTVKYKFRPDGKRALEPKEDLKKRIGRSPDYGDALTLALAWRTHRPALSLEVDSRDAQHPGCPINRRCGEADCPRCGARMRIRSSTRHRAGSLMSRGNPSTCW